MGVRFTSKDKRDRYLDSLKQPPAIVPSASAMTAVYPDEMTQKAPYPVALAQLVEGLVYRPDWTFRLGNMDRGQGSLGLTLVVTTQGYNAYHVDRGQTYRVNHYFIVPAAAYDVRSWRAWLRDQLRLVESHECCEYMQIDGERPYAPSHGPGNDPYLVREVGTDADVRTSFLGELNP